MMPHHQRDQRVKLLLIRVLLILIRYQGLYLIERFYPKKKRQNNFQNYIHLKSILHQLIDLFAFIAMVYMIYFITDMLNHWNRLKNPFPMFIYSLEYVMTHSPTPRKARPFLTN